MASKQKINAAYITDMVTAFGYHRPIASTPGALDRISQLFNLLADNGIRAPNDWQPDFTGSLSLRWYDGSGDNFSGSKRSASVSITTDGKCHVRASIGDRSAGDSHGSVLPNLNERDAVTILGIIVGIIDGERREGGAA